MNSKSKAENWIVQSTWTRIKRAGRLVERVSAKKSIKSHQDLLVWQKSMDLVAEVYKIVALLPINEQYGLSSQSRRAAGSIPATSQKDSGVGTSGISCGFC